MRNTESYQHQHEVCSSQLQADENRKDRYQSTKNQITKQRSIEIKSTFNCKVSPDTTVGKLLRGMSIKVVMPPIKSNDSLSV